MSMMAVNEKDAKYAESRWVTQVGTIGDFLLTFGKIAIGLLANSAALLAEGVHSGADLLFDLVVLAGMKVARKKPDEGHPYGHGKFESLATILLAVILLLLAVGIVVDAIGRLGTEDLKAPEQLAFWVAMISIVTKEALFQYTIRVGKKLKSNIIIANAWHHRADSISSLAAMIGIGGALMGYPILDPIAAIAVAFFVSKVGFEIGGGAIKELTDSSFAVDQEVRERISTLIHEIPEVLSAHFLTPRQSGPDILVDVHVVVPLFLSVSEGHQVAEKVRLSLLQKIEAISEVVVHIDTEDDMERQTILRANRDELLNLVRKEISPLNGIEEVVRLQPHYNSDGIILDLVLRMNAALPLTQFHADTQILCDSLLKSEQQIIEVRISMASIEDRLP
ncbi:MAG: cation diffusion facilitator family transporter [Magnetococcus sp. DMHC-6]